MFVIGLLEELSCTFIKFADQMLTIPPFGHFDWLVVIQSMSDF